MQELCEIGLIPHKPERHYFDDPDTVRCPNCKGEYDIGDLKEYYDDPSLCPHCKTKLKPIKCWSRVCKVCGICY